MGRKRKSDKVDLTPPRRLTRSFTKHGKCAVSHECTGLGAYVDLSACSDHEELFCKDKKNGKDLRKKGSAKKLMFINSKLNENQSGRISKVGFGGLLKIKYSSIHEKLCSWLVRLFDINKLELVIPFRGSIKVDAHAVFRVFRIPMGKKVIDYKKESGGISFFEFYKLLGRENTQKAPTFKEAEEMLLGEFKGNFDDKWLQIWLLFAVSSLLCPTSCTTLCVRGFHAIFKIEEIKDYNWCQLVVDRLVKGIQDFRSGKKFVSGCLFFLTILYLDSLDISNFVDEKVEPRVSFWTEDKVARAISMDKSSENDFGKLPLKAQFASTNNTLLVQPERVEDLLHTNFTSPSITLSNDTLKQAFSLFSASINQAGFNFVSQLRQVPGIGNTAATSMTQETTGLTALAAACNVAIAYGTQQGDDAAGTSKIDDGATTSMTELVTATNTSLAQGTQQGNAAANTCLPAITQHATSATVVTEPVVPAANNTLQDTTSNVPVPNIPSGTNEVLETDDYSYSWQQQEVRKDCTIKFDDSGVSITAQATNSNVVLEPRSTGENDTGAANTTLDCSACSDDSYSGQQKEDSGIIWVEKQLEMEKGSFLNVVDTIGSSEARRDDDELNKECRDKPSDAKETCCLMSHPSSSNVLKATLEDEVRNLKARDEDHLKEIADLQKQLHIREQEVKDFSERCKSLEIEMITRDNEIDRLCKDLTAKRRGKALIEKSCAAILESFELNSAAAVKASSDAVKAFPEKVSLKLGDIQGYFKWMESSFEDLRQAAYLSGYADAMISARNIAHSSFEQIDAQQSGVGTQSVGTHPGGQPDAGDSGNGALVEELAPTCDGGPATANT